MTLRVINEIPRRSPRGNCCTLAAHYAANAYFSATQKLSVSDTAEHGDNAGGPRIITDETRCEMRKMLKEIQDGTYARKWIAENDAGRPWFKATRSREQEHPLEKVGSELRAMMPFLSPVTVRPDSQG